MSTNTSTKFHFLSVAGQSLLHLRHALHVVRNLQACPYWLEVGNKEEKQKRTAVKLLVHKQDRLLHILNDVTKDSRSIQVHATKNTMPPMRSWTADAFIFSRSLIFCGMWCISWSKGGQICLSTLVIAVGPGERLVDHSYKPWES